MQRADRLLVRLGHFESRAQARAAIEAGCVRADGQDVRKPSQLIGADAMIEARPAHPYVSRAALKLLHALDRFELDVSDRQCLDLGASTGGFTDVLLERGAARVTAVDVGTGQLHDRLRSDPRITLLEGRDARELVAADLPAPPDIVTVDASFIGLEKLLARPLSLAAPAARLVALFKPQFQVGRAAIGKGGIVTDASATAAAEDGLVEWLAAQGWPVEPGNRIDSPITGGDGNRERLILAKRNG
jgi:23S rRNA (cytidine1920-2'-O)/16S rRNA (cytidine1409-2'-O)-methyltransferase